MSEIAAVIHLDGRPVLQEETDLLAHHGFVPRSSATPWVAREGAVGMMFVEHPRLAPVAPNPHVDEDLMVVADARIDNHAALASALALETASPASLIAAAYRRWGSRCPRHLSGDFAFVLWNRRTRELLAVRDPMGTRTLHFASIGQSLYLSSFAIQIERAFPDRFEVNPAALLMWIMNHYDERHSMWHGLTGLRPGEALTLRRGEPSIGRLLELRPRRHGLPPRKEWGPALLECLNQAVAQRLADAEGPVSTMLSGGMDSSTITALATEHARRQDREVVAYAYRFPTLTDCDESHWSRLTAEHLGIPLESIDCEPFTVVEPSPPIHPMENPFQCADRLDLAILDQVQRRGGTSLLTGHGGDTMFANLPPIHLLAGDILKGRLTRLGQFWTQLGQRPLKSKAKAAIRSLFGHLVPNRLYLDHCYRGGRLPHMPSWIRSEAIRPENGIDELEIRSPRRFLGSDRQRFFHRMTRGAAGIRRATHWYQRAGNSRGIKVFHPFFDHRLAELLLAMPPNHLNGDGRPKGLLRELMKHHLPSEIVNRLEKPTLAAYYYKGIANQLNRLQGQIIHDPIRHEWIDGPALQESVELFLKKEPGREVADFLSALWTEIWLSIRQPQSFPHARKPLSSAPEPSNPKS
ncbi:hypothetical protein SCOR_22315 [Sulfidibacter corallicola]|uniref:asparagine synthase (glutamine-hydrolyzing) n=1 Tax=Sulfidibacter corallicola TaxID=2818388 RepID=A0A8A4TTZ9_SULCO|nr:asparagine synthase-related protein [Sulfidibacter corallicola]QTD52847.1 hypothetical protein J3U87_10250 [Sulfidibacter corallicola]